MTLRKGSTAKDTVTVTFRQGVGMKAMREIIEKIGCTFPNKSVEFGKVLVEVPVGKSGDEIVKRLQKIPQVRGALFAQASYEFG